MEKEKVKEKKKLSLKEIGPARLIMLFMAGIVLVILQFPNLLSSQNSTKSNSDNKQTTIKSNTVSTKSEDETDTYSQTLENRLQNVLKKVDGIGDVEVMITLKGSKEQIILKDEPYTQESVNEDDGEGGNRVSSSIDKSDSTVLVDGDNGESTPYVIQELEPEVEGVIIIAEGGANAEIKAEIIDAVQVLFDVPSHKVKVMKMNK